MYVSPFAGNAERHSNCLNSRSPTCDRSLNVASCHPQSFDKAAISLYPPQCIPVAHWNVVHLPALSMGQPPVPHRAESPGSPQPSEHDRDDDRRPNDNEDFEEFHSDITAFNCDGDDHVLPVGAPPPPHEDPPHTDWTPFDSRNEFEVANFLYKTCQMPQKRVDMLMSLWGASLMKHDDQPPFADNADLENVIDAATMGDIPWKSFSVHYTGAVPQGNVPSWMTAEHEVWYKSPRAVAHQIIGNADISGEFDKVPYRKFVHVEGAQGPQRRFGNFMSANWPWEQADIIAEDERMHGTMFSPIILGSDKTTVSVATANRAHKKSKQFLKFRQQLFHSSLAAILDCLRPYMAERYDLVRCDAHRENLGPGADRRTEAIREALINTLDPRVLWDEYGIVHDIIAIMDLQDAVCKPFTNDFPRADIHELLSGDLLHQVIKGAFKDHLVTWVGEYLVLEHGEARGKEILDEIDRRIAATPYFPGLRHFYEGREFKQWTGDDSKALMKVCITTYHLGLDKWLTRNNFLIRSICPQSMA
ncbi:uncharacterized protein C8Q71DRAFT_728076 [Rhodofomes roseus]|uniref:Uncharacterized protein n=1 Tax=Rhodofomes roseus TaxID=34475 RepID=A0ABQ8JZ23_9APHY|nr:uncharacterized protein C8Q71DRAFT_728076 [Rhodofomes roseus]KAH9829485.1 hypothetical protein C8Q71DRAFT_728076 [Rhodofomes roseus]